MIRVKRDADAGPDGRLHFTKQERADEAFVSDVAITGLNQDDFETIYTVDSSDVSFAFHRDTPDWVIQRFQRALDDIKAEGLYDRVFEKYRVIRRNN